MESQLKKNFKMSESKIVKLNFQVITKLFKLSGEEAFN